MEHNSFPRTHRAIVYHSNCIDLLCTVPNLYYPSTLHIPKSSYHSRFDIVSWSCINRIISHLVRFVSTSLLSKSRFSFPKLFRFPFSIIQYHFRSRIPTIYICITPINRILNRRPVGHTLEKTGPPSYRLELQKNPNSRVHTNRIFVGSRIRRKKQLWVQIRNCDKSNLQATHLKPFPTLVFAWPGVWAAGLNYEKLLSGREPHIIYVRLWYIIDICKVGVVQKALPQPPVKPVKKPSLRLSNSEGPTIFFCTCS